MADSPGYLLDTNIILRISDRQSPEFSRLHNVLHLLNRSASLYYLSQNLIEFWNVCTRPKERNGYGLSIPEADTEARGIEKAFKFLPDTPAIHSEWRHLVLAHSVSGVQVHDARLVAAMKVYGISNLLTFNVRDFRRYAEITVIHPTQVAL
jgi:predicted nucleic acid-binding protein